MEITSTFANLPKSSWYAVAPFLLIALALSSIRLYTTWNYYDTLKKLELGPKNGKTTISPPQIPYTLPFLGNSLGFLNLQPGQFWQKLFSWHPRTSGACTLLLGGRKTHILYSKHAVQAMFKDRIMKRDVFERDMYFKVFLMPAQQVQYAMDGMHFEHEMNAAYLTRPERVNELTATFCKVLDSVLSKDAEDMVKKDSVGLYDWLRDRMFTASTVALLGDNILKMYPNYCEDFFKFDQEFLAYLFGLPNFMLREAIVRRKRLLDKLEEWSKAMHEESGGEPIDPEGPSWEPLFGSRLNRARQLDYKKRKLNSRSGAALDLGITFGLSSNVIPATGWMLMHILNPKGDPTLLGRVMTELKRAEKPDGSVEIATLVTLPLIQSIWTETLRLHTDVLVTRNLAEDTTLPLDEDGKTSIKMRKGDSVFAPSWISQHDPHTWHDGKAPPEVFYADRFVVPDPENPGQQVFSMAGTSGKFFPFGGGRTICPGRVFAKQEGMGALAMILLRFEFDVLGFVDKDSKAIDHFPGFANQYPGAGALTPGGDFKVRMRRRERLN